MRNTYTVAIAVMLAVAPPASGHHGYARIDRDAVVAFEGTVTQFSWRNPHVYFTVRTTDENGELIEWGVETRSTPVLTRSGWTRDSLNPGDVVTVRGHPERDSGRNYALLVSLERDDGTVFGLSPRESQSSKGASDLNGVWQGRGGLNQGLAALSLTEKGLAAQERYDLELDTPRAVCVGDPTPTTLSNRLYLNKIEISEDIVVIRNEFLDTERTIHMDGRGHPENDERTLHGHSIGHWEDGTLIVDTRLFADHRSPYGVATGVPSGAQKHVFETYVLSEDGTRAVIDIFLEDPEYLAEPFEGRVEWDYTPDFEFYRFDCDLEVARRSTPD